MPEATNYTFTHKEIAEVLIKKQDIHEGFWAIHIEFGLGAANISSGPEDQNVMPSALVPVKKIGIQKFDQQNPLTVDAALVNPVKTTAKTKRK